MAKGKDSWVAFKPEGKAPDFAGDKLQKAWKELHAGDGEPFPDEKRAAALLKAAGKAAPKGLDAKALAASIRSQAGEDPFLVLDAISSLGAASMQADAWGWDSVVAGSQKALMVPPGLAFASISPRAVARRTTSASAAGSTLASVSSEKFLYSAARALRSNRYSSRLWSMDDMDAWCLWNVSDAGS